MLWSWWEDSTDGKHYVHFFLFFFLFLLPTALYCFSLSHGLWAVREKRVLVYKSYILCISPHNQPVVVCPGYTMHVILRCVYMVLRVKILPGTRHIVHSTHKTHPRHTPNGWFCVWVVQILCVFSSFLYKGSSLLHVPERHRQRWLPHDHRDTRPRPWRERWAGHTGPPSMCEWVCVCMCVLRMYICMCVYVYICADTTDSVH